MRNLFMVVLLFATFSVTAFGDSDAKESLRSLINSMSRMDRILQADFAQKRIIPVLKVWMDKNDPQLVELLRDSAFRLDVLPQNLKDLIENYTPFVFAELQDIFQVEFQLYGDWRSGVTPKEFAHELKLNSHHNIDVLSKEDHFSYLDRVIVRRQGSKFRNEQVIYTLPNPEAVMKLVFRAYFYDVILTIPLDATLEQTQKFLSGAGLRPVGFDRDTKRLPPFFNDRIDAARRGMSSTDYYCQLMLKTNSSLHPTE